MNGLLYPYCEIIYAFLSYIFIYKTISLRIEIQEDTRKFTLFALLIMITDFIIYEFYHVKTEYGILQHLPNYIEYFIVIIVIIILSKNNRMKSLYFCVLGYSIVLAINLCFDIIVYMTNWYGNDVIYVLLKMLLLIVVYSCMKKKLRRKSFYREQDFKMFSMLAALACYYIYFITWNLPEMDFTDGVSITYLSIYLMLFLISIYIIFYRYLVVLGKRNQSLDEAEYQLDNQRQQKQLLEELKKANQENRKLRHDLKHHFHSLEYMMDTDPEKAKSYLHELSEHVEAVKVLTTKNQVLDYIINSKMAICRTKGIAFTYEVQDNLKQMQDFDLISLLSNALDNAIEAQEYVNDKFISCSICDGKTTTIIHIENACNISKLQKNKHTFQTIKKDKGQHGIGLGRIQTIAESYHGHMKIQTTENFILEISIPKNQIEVIN